MSPLRLLRLANIVLAGLLAYVAYSTVEGYLGPPAGKAALAAKKSGEQAPEAREKASYQDYRIIGRVNLFRSKDIVKRPPTPTPVPPTPRPLPPLKLELKGTTTSRRNGNVKAIIYDKKTRKTAAYGMNEVIPNTEGATIVEIKRNSVVLDRAGRRETLQLYPEEATGSGLKGKGAAGPGGAGGFRSGSSVRSGSGAGGGRGGTFSRGSRAPRRPSRYEAAQGGGSRGASRPSGSVKLRSFDRGTATKRLYRR